MAVCEIWDVRGRLDHPIDYAENPEKTINPKYTETELQALVDVMEYATNQYKTEKRYFVTGVNCDPACARDEMMIAKQQWNDESEIVCYHGFQSFKHGEVTPEVAHEVGVKLAEKMWGDRFQVVVATHLNTECLHNHFVVNSVSFVDGKHYYDNKANLRLLRKRSDELCREYSLSVIEHPSGRKKPYALYQAEKQGLPSPLRSGILTDRWRKWATDAALTLIINTGRLWAKDGNAPSGCTGSERTIPMSASWSVSMKIPMRSSSLLLRKRIRPSGCCVSVAH